MILLLPLRQGKTKTKWDCKVMAFVENYKLFCQNVIARLCLISRLLHYNAILITRDMVLYLT